jgi:hypothetical protein
MKVLMSPKKALSGKAGGEVQGMFFYSNREKESFMGVRASKGSRVMLGGLTLLSTARPHPRARARIVGKFQHMALPLRHPLSVLERSFVSTSELKSGPHLWTRDKWEEMLQFLGLVPLLRVRLSSPWDPILTASDASSVGLGVSETLCTIDSISELASNSNFKGDYTHLLSVRLV